MFLSVEEPEQIIELLEKYPKFRPMYEQVYEMCRSTERVMGMFSRELKELDDNTVEFMIDELKEMVDKEKARAEEAETRAREAEEEKQRAIKEIEEERQKEGEEKKQALKKVEEIQRKYRGTAKETKGIVCVILTRQNIEIMIWPSMDGHIF